MHNKFMNYKNIELWQEDKWEHKVSSIYGLVQWICSLTELDPTPYSEPVNGLYGKDCAGLPYYDIVTNSLPIPEKIKYWNDRGMTYLCTTQGNIYWLTLVPTKACEDHTKKIKSVVVFHREDYSDPYWAVKTLDKYADLHEKAAAEGDTMVLHLVTEGHDKNGIYANIMQEEYTLFPGDVNSVMLDVSEVYKKGRKLSECPDFTYKDKDGNIIDPDSAVTEFLGIPVLDISRRWENMYSLTRHQTTKERWSSLSYTADRLIRSINGKKMTEGIRLEYLYDDPNDPGFVKYWADMGLVHETHDTKGERWISAFPKGAIENGEKRPLLLIFQEVNYSNEHLPITAASYFYECYRMAAEGNFGVITFALEDYDSNDLLREIVLDAAKTYPIDLSRVYTMGHSHNGYFAYEFGRRHPDMVAGIATLGDPPGLIATRFSDEQIESLNKIDLPVINLSGMREFSRFFPLHSDADDFRAWQGKGGPMPFTKEARAKTWQRRLRASNCPMRTDEEIFETKNSPERAIRELGIPGEKSDVLYMDGFEHYIVDIKNNDGRYHLRMVGVQEMPHNATPFQQELAWSFLRRFKRDRETLKIIELF